MDAKTQKSRSDKTRHLVHEVEAGVGAAIAGAAMGAVAGAPGAVAGAVIAGVVGALADVALERQAEDAQVRDARLDDEIGETGGDLGAPCLEHPPATRGVCSAASSGINGILDGAPAEGPIQGVD